MRFLLDGLMPFSSVISLYWRVIYLKKTTIMNSCLLLVFHYDETIKTMFLPKCLNPNYMHLALISSITLFDS